MPNEIQSSAQLAALKNGASVSFAASTPADMAGNEMLQETQLIGTAAELLTWGEIGGAPRKVLLLNVDPTNFVTIAGDSGITNFPQKIRPGDFIVLCPTAAAMYAKADTAPVRIVKVAVEA